MKALPYLAMIDETYWGYFGIKIIKEYTEDNKMVLLWVLPKREDEIEADSPGGQSDWKVWYKKVIDLNDFDLASDGQLFTFDEGVRLEVFRLLGNTLANLRKEEQKF